jgi:AraC-like DNA-binding protein
LTFGRWRRRARLAAAIQMLADGADVTTVATSVGH